MQSVRWVDEKYVNLLSFKVEHFQRKRDKLWNFRCPLCGDSQKKKSKARGYIFEHKGDLVYKCHNCNASMRIKSFLRKVAPDLYEQYIVETLKEQGGREVSPKFINQIENFGKKRFEKFAPLEELKKISQLSIDHPARVYCDKRKIPLSEHYRLFYCPKFYKWGNKHLPGKFADDLLQYDEPRLVIPFIDSSGYVFAVTGRAFSKNALRYITLKFDDSKPKIFGLDKVDFSKKVYIVEGPIDSLFLSNSIAFAGSDGDLSQLPLSKDSCVCMDNEPRNKEIISRYKAIIDKGYNICIWPESWLFKDINEAILAGYSAEQIKNIIDTNTYTGLQATLKLNHWKKI